MHFRDGCLVNDSFFMPQIVGCCNFFPSPLPVSCSIYVISHFSRALAEYLVYWSFIFRICFTLSMLGKNFISRHFDTVLFFPKNRL